MFERYIEKSRRVIFFARHEAVQFGSKAIETEHILLGILRENPELINTFLSEEVSDTLRAEIEGVNPSAKEVRSPVDLPLSDDSKRVLAYAAVEADRLHYAYIGPEHLFLGLLCVKRSLAATLLMERGVQPEAVQAYLGDTSQEQRQWPAGNKRYKNYSVRIMRFLHTFSMCLLCLLVVQVIAKFNARDLPHSDVVFYFWALPTLLAATLLLTWLLHRRKRISQRKSVTYVFLAILIAFVSSALLIAAHRT